MSATLRPSPAEIDEQITAARAWLADDPSWYQRERYGAVVETLTWVQRGGRAPVSGNVYRIMDEQTLLAEMAEAHQAEHDAYAKHGRQAADRPGTVFQCLAWVLGRDDEPPVD